MTLSQTRHVYFSVTEQNPFLPRWYIKQLKDDLDPKLSRRLLYGEWIEIASDIVYHQYRSDRNFRDYDYDVDPLRPIAICWDFNIGIGKPLSICLAQYHPREDTFHFFNEVIVEGASTEDACHELADLGLLDCGADYVIYGDATGAARSTKSKQSDYDIIRKFLANYRSKGGAALNFSLEVPAANPPIRERHNLVNAYCQSTSGKTRLFVYRKCKQLNEGFRLTALKKGGSYIEDDSKAYQHVTTAAGYYVHRMHRSIRSTSAKVQHRQIR